MKRGFTLIELLGVIVILSVLLVFTMPNVINSIKKGNSDRDKYTADIIYKAAETYIKNNNIYVTDNPTTYCITLNDLVDGGLLEEPIEYNSISDAKNTMSVKATYSKKWNYSIVRNNECENSIICTKTTADNVTEGFVPNGNYNIGDEYICKLNNNLTYHFFVLSTNGNKVSLISSSKLGLNGEITTNSVNAVWYNTLNNSNGPVDAYDYIETNTSNWSNIPTIKNFNYLDGRYKGIFTRKDNNGDYITSILSQEDISNGTYTNIKARLPLLIEVSDAGCTVANNSCPSWIGQGYYLNNTINESNSNVYCISNQSAIASCAANTNNGIVPVIELNKTSFE